MGLLAEWDGHYRADSAGALAFELIIDRLARAVCDRALLRTYAMIGQVPRLVREDVIAAAAERLEPVLDRALRMASRGLDRYGTWGGMHRHERVHVAGLMPGLGRRYRFGDHPVAGSNGTVLQTAHPVTGRRHATRFGAVARHLSDMGDPDANHLVLAGGQDGWLRSSTFLDQSALWRRGETIRVPLRPETVRKTFPYRIDLSP